MNRLEQRKYHYIYRITRTDDSGKYYIGAHSTDDLNDGYLGSGQILWRSLKRHGKEKHSKEILEFLPTQELLKLREKELITEELIADKLCMNIVPGGGGGSDVGRLGAEALKKKRQDPEFEEQYRSKMLQAGVKFRERRLSDPEFQEKLVRANQEVAKATKQKRLDDPDYDKAIRDKMSAAHLGRKDTADARANKSAAQQIVAIRDLEKKQVCAYKAREALATLTPEKLADVKLRQAEGARCLAQKLNADNDLRAAIMEKKYQTRIKNGNLSPTIETRSKLSTANRGKKRSVEVVQRQRERKGPDTCAYGTKWMKLGEIRKRVKRDEVEYYENLGYVYGKV